MKLNKFPPCWDEKRVQRVLAHYERYTDEEAVAEDEAAYGNSIQIGPIARDLIAQTSSAEPVKS